MQRTELVVERDRRAAGRQARARDPASRARSHARASVVARARSPDTHRVVQCDAHTWYAVTHQHVYRRGQRAAARPPAGPARPRQPPARGRAAGPASRRRHRQPALELLAQPRHGAEDAAGQDERERRRRRARAAARRSAPTPSSSSAAPRRMPIADGIPFAERRLRRTARARQSPTAAGCRE